MLGLVGSEPAAGVDTRRVSIDERPLLGGQVLHLGSAHASEADAARQSVDRDDLLPEDLGQSSPCRPRQRFELERAILPMAEADPESGIVVSRRVDVGDGEAVTADLDGAVDTRHVEVAVGDDEATAQEGKGFGSDRAQTAMLRRAGRASRRRRSCR